MINQQANRRIKEVHANAGSAAGCCATEPAPSREIPDAFTDAQMEASMLRDAVERLVERVSPVLSGSNPRNEGCEVSRRPMESQIGSVLAGLADGMRATRAVVEDAISRAQL